MLRTDISRFFPTIYTHSVPWAVHGKAIAKKNRKVTPKFFGNLLDQSIRQGQDGQTMGIPIGPDTSHIIAEAIATSVDLEFRRRMKDWPAGFRFVDDYFLFFETASEAEAALAALMRALKEYELQINFEKTKTCLVEEITDDFWTHQLHSFEIASKGIKQRNDWNHYFELAKELAHRNQDESVMTYALKRAVSQIVRPESWEIFEAHVCHAALSFPNSLQIVARIFSTYHGFGYPLSNSRITRVVNALIQDHAPLGHHSEVAWCLWMCKDLDIQISSPNIDLVAEMHSSVCALILLDLETSGKLVKPVRTTYWKQFSSPEALHSDLWLLAYEAGVRGWGGFTALHVDADPHFCLLNAESIRFYDSAATLKPLFQFKPNVLKNRSHIDLFDLFDDDDIDGLVQHDESDGGYEGVSIDDVDDDDQNDDF